MSYKNETFAMVIQLDSCRLSNGLNIFGLSSSRIHVPLYARSLVIIIFQIRGDSIAIEKYGSPLGCVLHPASVGRRQT